MEQETKLPDIIEINGVRYQRVKDHDGAGYQENLSTPLRKAEWTQLQAQQDAWLSTLIAAIVRSVMTSMELNLVANARDLATR